MDELGMLLINMWQKPIKEAAETVSSELNEVGAAFGLSLATNIYERVS